MVYPINKVDAVRDSRAPRASMQSKSCSCAPSVADYRRSRSVWHDTSKNNRRRYSRVFIVFVFDVPFPFLELVARLRYIIRMAGPFNLSHLFLPSWTQQTRSIRQRNESRCCNRLGLAQNLRFSQIRSKARIPWKMENLPVFLNVVSLLSEKLMSCLWTVVVNLF